jgi:hypothetical protein
MKMNLAAFQVLLAKARALGAQVVSVSFPSALRLASL